MPGKLDKSLSFIGGIYEIRKGMTVHKVEGDIIHASQGYEILCSLDGGKSWQVDGHIPVPAWRKIVDSFPFLRRISRGGVSHFLRQTDGSRLCILPKVLMRAQAGSSEYESVFHFPRGSRPLNLCQGRDEKIYWGEYFLNLRRSQPVHIFCSEDRGVHWKVVFTFPKGSICHVHRVAYDPYDDAYLVCTGDRDREVAILRTTDGFRTLKPVVQGEQRYRTTSLVVLPQSILYGTDNPSGENYVMALNRHSGSVDRIQKLPGPALYGCQVGNHTVFATMVERQHHEVSLWSGDESGFSLLAYLGTHKWNRPLRELTGYPTAILPEGKSNWPYLYFTPVGTGEYAHSLVRMDLNVVLSKNAESTKLGA